MIKKNFFEGLFARRPGQSSLTSGLLGNTDALIGLGLLQGAAQGKDLFSAGMPAVLQAGKIKKAFTPTFKKTKQAYDNVLLKNVFVTDREIASMPTRFTPIDNSQATSFNAETGDFYSGSVSGMKLKEKNKINDARAAKMLQGTYGYLKNFIPVMQESARKTPSGAVGGTLAFIDSVSDQFNQLGEFTGIKNSKISFGTKTDKFLESKGLQRDAANYAKLKGSVTKLGYSLAKIEEPDNPRLSEGDVLRQLDRINFGGSRNQFVNSLQGILEDEYISGQAKYKILNPKGKWGFDDPRKKSTKGNDKNKINNNQVNEEDILGYFK